MSDVSNLKNKEVQLNAKIESLNGLSDIDVWFEYGIQENNLINKGAITNITSVRDASLALTNLSQDSIYYYRFCEKNLYETSCTNKKSFRTYLLPSVDIIEYSGVGYGVAAITGRVSSTGLDSAGKSSEYWFEYGIGSGYSESKSTTKKIISSGQAVTEKLESLKSNTEYYFRLCAKNLIGTVCTESLKFTVWKEVIVFGDTNSPVVETLEYSQTASSTIKLFGKLSKMGMFSTLNYYFEYGENLSFGNKINENYSLSAVGEFNYTLAGVIYDKTYYYRACVKNDVNVFCGAAKAFTIKNYKDAALSVKNYKLLEIDEDSAKISGIVEGFGGYTSVIAWFIISRDGVETESDKINVSGVGRVFSTSLIGLKSGEKYSYRLCVANSATAYCDYTKNEFYTLKNPSIGVANVDKVINNKTTIVGEILVPGHYLDDKIYGWFEYGLNVDNLKKTEKTLFTGAKLSYEISGLIDESKYYYRFCINAGINDFCGDVKNFTVKNYTESENNNIDIPNTGSNTDNNDSGTKNNTSAIKEEDKIPVNVNIELSLENAGGIIRKYESPDELWYVNKSDLKRYYLNNKDTFYNILSKFFIKIDNKELNNIPVFIDINYGKDTDKDGISDVLEKKIGTKYNQKDSDGDGYDDYTEIKNDYSPLNKKVVKMQFDSSKIENNLNDFFITNTNDVWYINKNDKKRYYIGNTNDKNSMFNVLKIMTKVLSYENFLSINYSEGE